MNQKGGANTLVIIAVVAVIILGGIVADIIPSPITRVSQKQGIFDTTFLASPSLTEGTSELVSNGGFENVDTLGKPIDWTLYGNAFSLTSSPIRSGNWSLQMKDSNLDTYTPSAYTKSVALGAGVYTLSFWVKTDNLGLTTNPGAAAAVYFQGPSSNQAIYGIKGTMDWTFYQKDFTVTAAGDYKVKVNAYYKPAGTAWFDDISLTIKGTTPPDTTPPTTPTNLTATAISSTQINLSWTASTDNVGVTGYRIYRGSTQIGTSPTTNYSDTGLSPSTTYTYTVAAYDAAGNNSTQSSPVSATTLAPPTGSQCSDGLDNDLDGKTDYPDDLGCSSALDAEEFNAPPPPAPVNGLVAGGLMWYPVPAIGPNLLANPGFESGIAPWTMGSSFTLDNTVSKTGSNSLKMVNGQSSSHARQVLNVKKGNYRIGGWVKLQGLEGSGVRFSLAPKVWGQPGGGGATELIKGDSNWQYLSAENLVVTNDMNAVFSIYPYSNPPGTAWFDDLELREEFQPPIDVFMLYPNYRGYLFDDQSQTMRFDITINPPAGTNLSDYRVESSITDETTQAVVLTQTFSSARNFIATLNGSGLLNGRTYLVRFKLVKVSDSSALYEYPAYRISKVSGASRSSMAMSFNEDNQILFRGQPKFLLGVYDAGMGYGGTESFWENLLFSDTGSRRMNGLPINSYLNYWYNSSPSESLNLMMNVLQRHGIMYLQSANCHDRGYNKTIYNKVLTDDAYLSALSIHPDLAGFYTMDECFPELALPVFNDAQRLKAFKPDGITFATSDKPVSLFFWRDAADLLSTDPYPINPLLKDNLSRVADWTKATKESVNSSRPIATVIQFFKTVSASHWPTQQELRDMSYMAIAEGSNGLFYWSLGVNALSYVCSGWCDTKIEYFTRLKNVLIELDSLQPALSSLDRPDLLVSNSNPSIHARVKFVNDKGYLIASNYSNTTATATFTWAQTPTLITVYNESRTLPPGSSSFTDSFGPYQAHVYEISTTSLPPDTQAPTTPTNLTATAISSTQINLSWTASTDNIGVVGYKVYRNGIQIAIITSGTTYSDSNLSPSTAYSYTVSAYDAAGNTSVSSPSVSATTLAIPTPIPPPPTNGGGGGGGGGSGGGGGAVTIPGTAPGVGVAQIVSPVFKTTLRYGMTSDDVKRLQQLLASDKEIYPEGLITGYFGPLTRQAVQRFQVKYNIVSSGNENTTGYGLVGPKTKAKLNEVFGQQLPAQVQPTLQVPSEQITQTQIEQIQQQIQELLKKIKVLQEQLKQLKTL